MVMLNIYWGKWSKYSEVIESSLGKNKWTDFINYIGKNLDYLYWEEIE